MNLISRKYALLSIAVAGVLAAGGYFLFVRKDSLEGIAYGNGRIEAQSIDVATRYAARVSTMPVEEGQMVAAGDVVAELDLGDLSASLNGAEANVRAREQQRAAAESAVKQAQSALSLAEKEFARVDALAKDKAVSQSRRDQALNERQSAAANVDSAKQNLAGASEAIGVAQAEVDRLKDLLTDRNLRAPKEGRILYKLAEPGEVIPAGGKVVTLLDLKNVYMSIFLPANEITRMRLGAEARIVLDALPGAVIPAYVSYISPEAQFTPRQVETRSEREKLTFRVKVRIPAPLLGKYIDAVKTGVPGMAYVKLDDGREWPAQLMVSPELAKIAAEQAAEQPASEAAPQTNDLETLQPSSSEPESR
ncbi:MAG: HlyD family efflux transporter periplasmic adaptor subunit [Blastochloris viridis]|uniref:HlyD family efflux transporter periplasmic adaptor subunit n=1 Tax=Blastochloris viridis TaxID=1079 RepID=A0A6N4RCU2_BLAVI|nr:MAG: HlyD family efflux transporter periplasmic adaptor subunit [Blastochloris viridis]